MLELNFLCVSIKSYCEITQMKMEEQKKEFQNINIELKEIHGFCGKKKMIFVTLLISSFFHFRCGATQQMPMCTCNTYHVHK